MASKFLPGMKNVLEVLNQMWDAFAAGPYNALPLTGGNLAGPVSSNSIISAPVITASTQIIAGLGDSASSIRAANNGLPGQPGVFYEVGALSVAHVPELSNSGRFFWSTCSPGPAPAGAAFLMRLNVVDASTPGSVTPVLVVSGSGDLSINRYLTVGPVTAQGKHQIYSNAGQFTEILHVGRVGTAAPCVGVNASDGTGGWPGVPAVLYVGKNSQTASSIRAAGTINASGADYAEYMVKSSDCGVVLPGQIVGIDAAGRLTDQWVLATAYAVKSTNPCMVGGDSWGQHLGQRPAAPTRVAPTTEQVLESPAVPADDASGVDSIPAVYKTVITAPGDTDDEWAARQQAHQAALAAFEIALEIARQSVDRIAFAGQVPVNVQGAMPGQYIVPVQDGEGIAGQAFDEADMTLGQYMRALGRVIAIEDDGRARMIVKVA